MNVDSVGGSKYVLTFTDHYTRYVTVCLIKSKSEVLSMFVEYVTMMENETDLRVRAIRTENGGECTSQNFLKYWDCCISTQPESYKCTKGQNTI